MVNVCCYHRDGADACPAFILCIPREREVGGREGKIIYKSYNFCAGTDSAA